MENRTWVGRRSREASWKAVTIGGTNVMGGRTREGNGKNGEADEKKL